MVDQVISKRFVENPQMTYTGRGAQLLLQIRVRAVTGDLRAKLRD